MMTKIWGRTKKGEWRENKEKPKGNVREISRKSPKSKESHKVTDGFQKKKKKTSVIHLINSKLVVLRQLTAFCTIASTSVTQNKKKTLLLKVGKIKSIHVICSGRGT